MHVFYTKPKPINSYMELVLKICILSTENLRFLSPSEDSNEADQCQTAIKRKCSKDNLIGLRSKWSSNINFVGIYLHFMKMKLSTQSYDLFKILSKTEYCSKSCLRKNQTILLFLPAWCKHDDLNSFLSIFFHLKYKKDDTYLLIS